MTIGEIIKNNSSLFNNGHPDWFKHPVKSLTVENSFENDFANILTIEISFNSYKFYKYHA